MLNRSYLFPLFVFLTTLGLGVGLYTLLIPLVTEEMPRVVMRTIFGVIYIILTIKYIDDTDELFCLECITKQQVVWSIFLILLFGINNYFHSAYSTQTAYMHNSSIGLVLMGFAVNSFYEEFAYRGFIQGYVNQSLPETRSPISQGNWFASILMLVTHFGFFMVMDTLFAITGLILVFVFSLIAGYMRDKGASIWLLIVLHTAVNAVHIMLNWEHYY